MTKTIYQKLMESGKQIPENEEEIEQANKFSEAMQKVEEEYRRKKSAPDDTIYCAQINLTKHLPKPSTNIIPYGNSF